MNSPYGQEIKLGENTFKFDHAMKYDDREAVYVYDGDGMYIGISSSCVGITTIFSVLFGGQVSQTLVDQVKEHFFKDQEVEIVDTGPVTYVMQGEHT
jgi:hypothetical protein